MSTGQQHINDEDRLPAVEIVAAPRYYIGLPIVVSVTWDNPSADIEFFLMPPLDLTFARGGDISVSLVPVGPDGARLETRFAKGEEYSPTVTVQAGEKRTMVCDLSNLGALMRPGTYGLTLTVRQGSSSRASNQAQIELVSLEAAGAAEAARLRQLGGASPAHDTGAWGPFLSRNLNTVVVSPALGQPAQEQLALHLFMHRATWLPGTVAGLDARPLDAIHGPHLAAETSALRYEIARARHDPHATTMRTTLLQQFPGLRHRVEAADHGEGTLAVQRRAFGVESAFVRPPARWPYQP
jgi:hypothetical protein